MKDLWIIGDRFLLDVHSSLSKLKSDAVIEKRPIPYIYDYYNVKLYTANPLSEIRNTMTRLVNSLTKALNDATMLPRIILIIPDDNILRHIKDLTDIKPVCVGVINWIMNEMDKVIQSKKDQLKQRKAGAIAAGEPKMIWVAMINRMNICSKLLSVRSEFNKAIEACMANRSGHYFLDVASKIEELGYFNQEHKLNEDGKTRLWKEIDYMIEKFDFQKISLRPASREELLCRDVAKEEQHQAKFHQNTGRPFHRFRRQRWQRRKFFGRGFFRY